MEFTYSKSGIYRESLLIVKRLGINDNYKYKAIWCKRVKRKGYEDNDVTISAILRDDDNVRQTYYDSLDVFTGQKCKEVEDFIPKTESPLTEQKRSDSVSRAKTKIFEYAFCNEWDYFVTLTLDQTKYNRYDLQSYISDLGKWISNYKTHHGSKISYVLVPERHKDGAWHLHGLIAGILPKHLETNSNGYLDFPMYRKKFGFCSLDPIKSHEAVSKYITKYIGKGLEDRKAGERLYYCSKGLAKPEILLEIENVDDAFLDWDYEHEDGFVKVATHNNLDFLSNVVFSGGDACYDDDR